MLRPTFILFAAVLAARADWRDDIGLTKLQAELGAAAPTGAGIVLLQAEANTNESPPDYLPQAGGPGNIDGAGDFTGKTFHPESGAGTMLNHAGTVASYYYGNAAGVANGATEIHNYTAVDYLNRLILGQTPEALPGRVHNHSWVGTYNDENADTYANRALDYLIEEQGRVASVAISGGTLSPLFGSSYHGITIGSRAGTHSTSGTTIDGAGRMKPDLVAPVNETSYNAGMLGGSAACLLEEGVKMGSANAQKPQSIKAILIAGASKERLPQWQRSADTKPYDNLFGAGELNIYNAWHILNAGEQNASTTVEVGTRGWDFASTTLLSAGRRYFFRVPTNRVAKTFSAALVWHRTILNTSGNYSSLLPNLTLKLYAANNLTAGALISSSTSSLDNVEHLHLYNLPPGQYALEVTANTLGHAFTLAWDAQVGAGPALIATRAPGGAVTLAASGLDPFVTYTLETGTSLTSWGTAHTFRTADTTPAFDYTWEHTTPVPEGQFYRLRWTPVR